MIPKYLEAARKDIGQRETLGPNKSPFIARLWQRLGVAWLLGQPWCGGAMAKWVQEAGLPYPKHFYRAKAWLDWGLPCGGPRLGAIAVLGRQGGGHVGIVTGQALGFVRLLGGNQGDAVRESWFAIERVLGYRQQSGILLAAAPQAVSGELSETEA